MNTCNIEKSQNCHNYSNNQMVQEIGSQFLFENEENEGCYQM